MIIENYLRKVYAAHQIAELCKYEISEDERPEDVVKQCLETIENLPDQIKEKIAEISKLMESMEPTEDFTDEELEKIIDGISDDDILDEYDEDELVVVDEETGEILETEELPTEINELLSRQARMKAKIRFGRTKAKRQMKAKIALKRHSSRETLNKRARRLAIRVLKAKFAKKKVGDMSLSDKERVEKILSSRKALINRLALKLVPRVKKLEKERLS